MLQARGAPPEQLPEWARTRPYLAPGDEWYMRAFWELSTTRALGFGAAGPIPWHHIVRYGERAGLEEGMISLMVHVIRELDYVYLAWTGKEQERRSKQRDRGKGGDA